MNTITKISVITGLGLVGIGILSYLSKQANMLKNACYTLAGVVINEISFTNMSLDLLLNISNKSDISFTVTKQVYNIYVNKMLVAVIQNPKDIRVNARGKSTMKINISFNPQDLLKKGIENITSLIKDKESMVIEIKGTLSLQAGFVTVNDYQVDERISLKELLAPSISTEKC